MANQDIELSVSEFVALLNQTLEFAFSGVLITGEMANLRVSKNRWVYFDLKDENSTVKFFGTIYQLPGPLEDGMMIKVRGLPKLHNLYGFSVKIINIQLAGEGSIKRAAQLLEAKLKSEGLFEDSRKRPLMYPPSRIGLITSKQSAAYADFIKIINSRWRGIDINLIDVQVQGEVAPSQITTAIDQFNSIAEPPDVIIIIRGGGSPEDLAAFNTEQVTRAVAGSRVPTLVAVGHEIDFSLAELVADRRASTPSNAAELLVPDRQTVLKNLIVSLHQLTLAGDIQLKSVKKELVEYVLNLSESVDSHLSEYSRYLTNSSRILNILNPESILQRGYAIVRSKQEIIKYSKQLKSGDIVNIQLAKGGFNASVANIEDKK